MKTNKKHCKTLRQFDFDSTLVLEQGKALSTATRHLTWYSRKPCRGWLDIGPGTAESAVDCDSTLVLVQRKALSIVTRHCSWYSGKRCPLWLDIGHTRLTVQYLIPLPSDCVYVLRIILKINIGYSPKQSNKLCWLMQCMIGQYILVTYPLFAQRTTPDIHVT